MASIMYLAPNYGVIITTNFLKVAGTLVTFRSHWILLTTLPQRMVQLSSCFTNKEIKA